MTLERRIAIWAMVIAAFAGLLYVIWPALMPFLAGLAIAYLLDPAVRALERRVGGRALATALVGGGFFVAAASLIFLLAPVLQTQAVGLAERLADLAIVAYERARPYVEELMSRAGEGAAGLGPGAKEIATEAVQWTGRAIKGLWSGGLALFNLLSLVFVTPVVAFYLLRDWDRIMAALDRWLPRDQADAIRDLARGIDKRMAGFVRGQAMVCLLLGAFYAVALSLAGLSYGLIIGLLTGLFSFIPYVGMLAGMTAGLLVAAFQFESWLPVAIVLAIFLAGQFIEGNFVAPKLVGDRVGLHPVWIMLAVLAGGTVLGFMGVLLAVPVAAALGEIARFTLARYLASPLYTGRDTGRSGGKGQS